MAKKNYNPFKMWGSYAGAIVLAFGSPTKPPFDFTLTSPTIWINILVDSGVSISNKLQPTLQNNLIYVGVPILIGFLIGWGIHSLVRKLRK